MDESTNQDINDLNELFGIEIKDSVVADTKHSHEKKESSPSNEENKKRPRQRRRPRKPQMKLQLDDINLEPISPVISGYSSSSNSPRISSTKQVNLITDIENRINNYLDSSLKIIKTEFCTSLEIFLENENKYDDLVSNFINSLLPEVSKEIKFKIPAATFPLIPIKVDFSLPKQNFKTKTVCNSIAEFSTRNITLSKSISMIHKEFKENIHSRNKYFKKQEQERETLNKKLKQAKTKCLKHYLSLKTLEANIESLKDRENYVSRKSREFNERNVSKKVSFVPQSKVIDELNILLPELSKSVDEPFSFEYFNTQIDSEVSDIKRRRNSIESVTQEIIKAFTDEIRMGQMQEIRTTASYLPQGRQESLIRNRSSFSESSRSITYSPRRMESRTMTVEPDFLVSGKLNFPLVSSVY